MLYAECFQNLIKDELKTIRKKNGFCYFLTQEPNDVLSHPLAPTLVTQLATLVLLENNKASKEHYIDGLKLTDSEFSLVQEIGEGSRQFVIKNSGQTAKAYLDLNGDNFKRSMAVLSGTPDNAVLVDKIKQKLHKDKVNNLINSEFSTEKEKEKALKMQWFESDIKPEEWLPIYWNQLEDASF